MEILRENDLFELLKNTTLPDLVMSRNQFSKWDCYSPDRRLRIELKCRRTHYPELVIEKIKYDALMDKALKNGDKPIYINSTPVGVFFFDLSQFSDLKWFQKRMPITTEFSSRHYVEKNVAMLDVSKGYNITEKLINNG